MKLTNNAEAALQQPDTKALSFEMTSERREKLKRVTDGVVDYLMANTDGPVEAYMCLQFLMHAFEEKFGIRGGIIVDHDDQKH